MMEPLQVACLVMELGLDRFGDGLVGHPPYIQLEVARMEPYREAVQEPWG
jgi:hypothetical protein